MWSTFLWIIPHWIQRFEAWVHAPQFPFLTTVGWTVFATASCLGLWSAFTMAWFGEGTPLPLDTARKFVVQGPYRWIRNPMAVAGLMQGIGIGFTMGSYGVFVYCVVGGMLWQIFARPVEEADLAARFGVEYERYRQRVHCWIPRIEHS